MSSNPENDINVDWPDEMTFSGTVATMHPNGPTDFGIGPHVREFNGAIGGCDLDFEDTIARGYMYRTDDTRDIEYKCFVTFSGISEGEGFSISANTGRHTDPKPCCQGNAYMANLDPNADPDGDQFRFRKEIWHVSYHNSPEGWFNDPRVDFNITDHGKIGFGFCRYNDPDSIEDTVICEMWLNPTPDTDKNNWFLLKQVRDTYGNGWGNDGDDCGGTADQPLLWAGPQSRCKTNSTGGTVKFEAITFREIDPSRDFDDPPPPPPTCPPGQIWDGTKCVVSGGGGGGPPPPTPGGGGTVNPIITYCAASSFSTTGFSTIPSFVPVSNTTLVLSEEIPECMINPDRFKRFGNYGWVRDTTNREGADIGDRPCDFSIDLINIKTYPSGLIVETYWDEAGQICVCPGVGNGTPGGPTAQDTIIIYAVVGTDSGHFASNMAGYTDTLGHEIVEAATDPEAVSGWIDEDYFPDGSLEELSDRCQDGNWYGGNVLWMQGYWSNSDDKCVAPGLSIPDNINSNGFTLHDPNARVLKNPKVFLIFWGNNWRTRTSSPTANDVIVKVRDKMLNTYKNYFSKLFQYGGINIPIWGNAIYNDAFPVPSGKVSDQAIHDAIIDTIERGLTPRPAAINDDIYVLVPPYGAQFSSTGFSGYHSWDVAPLTSPSGNDTVTHADLIDTNGIAWKQATGEIIGWGNSRDDPDDFRWSHDTENAGLGYEVTWIVRCNNIDLGSGHTALKCGGPNHSGDCGGHPELKEGSTCCCWYDLGIRSNGDVQTQIERPHPNNIDWDCDLCTMSNIGVNMEDHWIGIKLILYPEKPGGTSEDGGIRIKFYKDSNAITSGVPTNNWQLVVDMVDDGSILGNYDWPLYQELEMRLSGVNDINDVEMYKDQVFMRRITDTTPGSGGGGGGNTDGVYNHGGRMMHNPKLQVIFWGADWNSRAVNPTKAQVIDHLQNKLLATDVQFFNKLAQYGAPGVPTWLTPVVNTTVVYPTDGIATVAKLQEVIEQSLESGLCPIPTDFLNTIFVVLPEVDKNISVPTTDVGGATTRTDYRYRDCFKPVITLPGGAGGGGGSGSPTTIQGVFKFMRDINVLRVSSCAGSGSEGGGGGGGGSGTSVFYDVTGTSSQKEVSNESGSSNRTRITEKVNSSSAVMNNKLLKQADVLLKKESGTTDTTPLVYFKIWDNGWNVIYTSPTTFTPASFTTSFVSTVFDCSTNTHTLVVGDRVGIEFTGTSSSNYIWTAYQTSEGTGSSGSYSLYREGSSDDDQTSRRMSMKLYS